MNRRRNARIFLLLILLLIVGGMLVAACIPHESLLMAQATRVADTRSWASPQYYYSWIESLDRRAALYTVIPSDRSPRHYYRWIDDHGLLFFREKSPQARIVDSWSFYELDTLTGKETSLTALSHRVQNSFHGSSDFAISPDGKRFFWTGKGITVTTLNGEQPIQVAAESTGYFEGVAWARDSNHLIAYSTKPDDSRIAYRTLYDVEARKATQRLTIDSEAVPDAVTTNSRLLTARWRPRAEAANTEDTSIKDRTESVEIDEKEIGKETQPARKYSVLLPHKSCDREAYFSPQGDRIAWTLLQPADTPPLLAWIHPLFPAYKPPSSPTKISLWVSRLDGSRMHEVGYTLLPSLPNGSPIGWELLFDHISWLPDGKRLSFRHDGALYTVPAD